MGINNKYTPKQRKISRKIYRISQKQYYHRKIWLDLDIAKMKLKKHLDRSVMKTMKYSRWRNKGNQNDYKTI